MRSVNQSANPNLGIFLKNFLPQSTPAAENRRHGNREIGRLMLNQKLIVHTPLTESHGLGQVKSKGCRNRRAEVKS